MEFTIETADLKSALAVAAVAMTGKSTLPILSNIKIEADDGLTVSSTNLDIFVSKQSPAKVKKKGAVTLPYEILSRLTARMENKTISMMLAKNEIVFKSGDVTAMIETLPADEFPSPQEQDYSKAIECDAADLTKPFSKLIHAISDDSRRYELTGINFAPSEKNGTILAATNAARLVFYRAISFGKDNVIVPQIFAKAILSIDPKGPIKVVIGNGIISVLGKDVRVTSRLIEASYPNWKGAVPAQSDRAFSCGRENLISALETCAIFTARQTPGLTISGKGKEIEVSQPDKAQALILGTELSGQPNMSIRLNSRWMIETLNVFEGENIRIQLKDEKSPIMIEEGPLVAIINRMIDPKV